MKIDSAIKDFVETYDREAIGSIEAISRDFARVQQQCTIKGFNLTESFNQFCEYLRGYGDYKIKNANNPESSHQEAIQSSVKHFIGHKLFEECDIRYPDLPGFVSGYVDGVKMLTETIEGVKETMMDAGVDLEYVGAINEFADMFMDRLQESFTPTMDRFLWASGYNSRKALNEAKKNITPDTVFI